jgi:hypothetical protein
MPHTTSVRIAGIGAMVLNRGLQNKSRSAVHPTANFSFNCVIVNVNWFLALDVSHKRNYSTRKKINSTWHCRTAVAQAFARTR